MKIKCDCGREVELKLTVDDEVGGFKFYQWRGKCECGWTFNLSGHK